MVAEQKGRYLDPLVLQQHYLLRQYKRESEDIQKLKKEFRQFSKIKNLDEARKFAYQTYPRFRDNKSFMNSGVKYTIYDVEDNLRLMGWFPDEIICYEFV